MTYRRMMAAAGLAVAVGVGMSGCGSSSKPNPGLNQAASSVATTSATSTASTTTSAPPSVTAVDATEQAKKDALAAYSGMVKAMTDQLNSGKLNPAVLKYADGAAYDEVMKGLATAQRGKYIAVGQPQSSPKVTATNLSANPQSVSVSDCFGGPNWRPVFIADIAGHKKGESAGSPTPPHVLTAIVENLSGSWKVSEYTINEGARC